MKRCFLVFLYVFLSTVHAQEVLLNFPIEGRQGDTAPVLQKISSPGAVNLLLIPGGNAGTGELVNGIPSSLNFLVRSREDFQAAGLNTFILFRAKSVAPGPMSTTYRNTKEHLAEIRALFNHIVSSTEGPIFLVGTSMGTISATQGAINLDHPRLKGLLLTASVTKVAPGNLATQNLKGIKMPVMMVHHESDQCFACVPKEAKELSNGFVSASSTEFFMVSGGGPAVGDPCQNQHWHGFIGIEKSVTSLAIDWIKRKSAVVP